MEREDVRKDEFIEGVRSKETSGRQGIHPAVPQSYSVLGNRTLLQHMEADVRQNSAMIQKKQSLAAETKVKTPVIQGFWTGVKKALKSSIWGGVVGLCYCLLGLLTNPVSTGAVVVASVCFAINLLSIISNILSACKILDTPEAPTGQMEQAGGRGYQIAGGAVGAVGSLAAAGADIVYMSSSAKGIIDEILGLITETIAALKAVISLIGNGKDRSRTNGDKCIKGIKYVADLVASIIGIIAFSVAIAAPSAAAWIFIGEVTIRALRVVGSIIKTILDSRAKKPQEAPGTGSSAEAQGETGSQPSPIEGEHMREIIPAPEDQAPESQSTSSSAAMGEL